MKHLILTLAAIICCSFSSTGAEKNKKAFFTDWFMALAGIESQSSESDNPEEFNINPGQTKIAQYVVEKVKSMYARQIAGGKLSVDISDLSYVYIKVPRNVKKDVPSVMFMAHLDVTPEAPGENIKPIIHYNYDGSDIILPAGIVLSPETPYGSHLKNCIGKTIVTSDGSTLLGADDKSGCTVLLGLLDELMTGKVAHGDIFIVLSQNEDIGMAADGFEISYVGGKSPDMVIDVDGEEPNVLSIGNFTAVSRRYIFHGNNVHPGNGKTGGYADALTAAATFMGRISPETHPSASEGEQGYIHCYSLRHPADNNGNEISTDYVVDMRIRYFDKSEGDTFRAMVDQSLDYTSKSYPFVTIESLPEKFQYENVAYTTHKSLPDIIMTAAKAKGIDLKPTTTRGGTTSAMMAAKGLNGGPCLYSGQQAEHSCYEWTCIEDIMDMSDLCLTIVKEIINH